MNRFILLATFLVAAPLCAGLPKNGDLLPRNDIIFYATSDRPDAAYRLFGKNEKGEWRLRAWPYQMLEKEAAREGADPQAEKQKRAMVDFFFEALDNTATLELGLLDVTLGGGKFVLVLRAKDGKAYNARPEFLKEMIKEEIKVRDIPVVVYEVKNEGKREGAREPGMEVPGFDRFYVAAIEGGLVVTNFESSMQDVAERFVTRDYSESLSSRPEFSSWRDTRKPHDLSFFIVGREIQKAVERVLPDEKMAGGRDVSGAYNEADRWLQLREYQSIVVDFDYDEARAGFGIDAKLTTKRKTRLLEQLAIAPAEFKLLKYLPQDAMFSAGVQLGDAATTWERFVEFARDGEKIAHRAMDRKEIPLPPKDEREKDESGNAPDGERPSKVEETLKEIDQQLAKFGTSLKEVLAALGSEALAHVTADTQRALKNGARGFGDLLEYSHIGAIVGIKDAKAAKAILDKVRNGGDANKDTFTTSSHGGFELNVNARQGWAYVLTADAVLLTFTRPQMEDGAAHLETGLKRMIDASKSSVTGDVKFVSPSSKFVNVNIGAAVGAYDAMSKALAERLDRYAEPQMDDWSGWFKATTISMRTVEDTMSVEVGLRLWGLPNFIDMFETFVGSGKKGSPRDAWRYTQGNLREIGGKLMTHAVRNPGQPTMESMLKLDGLRAAHFQTPFDARWKGGYEHLAWFGLSEARRDEKGNLPEWVNKDAVALVEANEKEGFNSYKLAEGDLRSWIQGSKAGFIVLYQTNAETCGGHMVLYADGEVGWLSAKVLDKALALNAKGEAVPGEDRWSKSEKRETPKRPESNPDDPWVPK